MEVNVVANEFLTVAFLLFSIGVAGVCIRKNIFVMFMSIELILNAANLVFVSASRNFGMIDAEVTALFIIGLAAAEAAVGLAIIVMLYRKKHTLDIDAYSEMRN